jgi:hypothetical protein
LNKSRANSILGWQEKTLKVKIPEFGNKVKDVLEIPKPKSPGQDKV